MKSIKYKQYLLSSMELDIPEMNVYKLTNIYIYVHDKLSIQQVNDKKGRIYYVLGDAFCMDIFPKQVSDDIKAYDGDSLVELTKNWTGRWLLICNSELITDATGLMSAFYHGKGTEEWMVSSSLSLLSNILNIPIVRSVSNQGLDWQLLPDTIMPEVSALFCTQSILFGKTLEIRNISRFSDKRSLTLDEKVNNVINRLQIGLKNIEKFSGLNLSIALTAGKDSRLVLASALSAEVKFSTYTMEHQAMSIADKNLPGKIANRYGFKWSFIHKKKRNQSLVDEYLKFNGGNSKGADIFFYSTGQTQYLSADSIIIRSAIFEAGQLYGRRTLGDTKEGFREGFYKYYDLSLQIDSQRTAFEKWIKYAEQNPIPYIDIRDRFYIEQRVNGWVSAIEQSLTINDFVSLQIANCQELISVLLSASKDERNNNKLALCMIKTLVPNLLVYPINNRTLIDKIHIIKRAFIKRFCK